MNIKNDEWNRNISALIISQNIRISLHQKKCEHQDKVGECENKFPLREKWVQSESIFVERLEILDRDEKKPIKFSSMKDEVVIELGKWPKWPSLV